jgi:hypothetical protein
MASNMAWAPDVGAGQMNHQEPPVGTDGDVALATDNLLARVVSPCCYRQKG